MTRTTAKTYKEDTDKPLWAVENAQSQVSSASTLWGLVAHNVERLDSYSYVQREHLYLPGLAWETRNLGLSSDNIPGSKFHCDALGSSYSVGTEGLKAGQQDYTGASDFAMFARWQELSKTPTAAAKIINLIWTDVATNAVVGTRSWLTRKPVSSPGTQSAINSDAHSRKRNAKTATKRTTNLAIFSDNLSANVPITIYYSRVRYRWCFAIPALLTALVVGILFSCALVMLIFGRVKQLRHYIFQLSAGRLLGNFLYPEQCHPMAPTKIWKRSVGFKLVKLGDYMPEASDHAKVGKHGQMMLGRCAEPLMRGEHEGRGKERIQVMAQLLRGDRSPRRSPREE